MPTTATLEDEDGFKIVVPLPDGSARAAWLAMQEQFQPTR